MKKILLLAMLTFSTNLWASPIQGITYYEGSIDPGSSVGFSLQVKPKEKLIIAARAEGKGNLDCFLFDEQDKLVAEYKDSTNTCLLEIIPKQSNYRVILINNGSVKEPYEITAQ